MKTVRLLLIASAALLALGLVAGAWAAPAADGGGGSGGAPALPVLPSSGGGSEPAPANPDQLGGSSGELPQAIPPMPPIVGVPGAGQDGAETVPEVQPIVPLPDEDALADGEIDPPVGTSSGGGFGFLASTGSGIVSLLNAGVAMVRAVLAR